MAKYAIFKQENPTPYYDLTGTKLGHGGFAQVYKVKRKSDKRMFALKLCSPNNEMDRQMMINEIGLMKKCNQENDSVLQIEEAFDDRGKLWIIVELMACSLTTILRQMRLSPLYTENALKYVLR